MTRHGRTMGLGGLGRWLWWFGLLVCTHAFGQGNLALNQPVESSGPNWGSFKPGALTDGDPNTFTHPDAAEGTLGFTYEVDLGVNRAIERIVLRNRSDGCCPERLTRVRIEVWSDGGGGNAGDLRWSALVRGDGSNSGVSGVDTVTAEQDADGVFLGRFVRVINASGEPYNPQLAEIEVYGGAVPTIGRFSADASVIQRGQSTLLQWDVSNAKGVLLEPVGLTWAGTAGAHRVAPESTTLYTLVATNEYGAAHATVRIGVDVLLQPPDISEFVAENGGELKDEDGDAPDWIEIENRNGYEQSLDGYFLTDDPLGVTMWKLPDLRVPAGGRVVVFASGKDRRDPRGPLHTDFRLRNDGDVLALLDRDGRTVLRRYPPFGAEALLFPRQRPHLSFGVGRDGRIGYLRPPTPGEANGEAYAGAVEDTKFSHDRGLYDTNFSVTLTTGTPEAVIRYTVDRSVPSATHGQVYSQPIPITGTTVLRAAAFRADWAPTDVDTHTYVFPSNVIASGTMRRSITTNAMYRPQLANAFRDIPSVSIVAAGTINGSTETDGSVEWIPSVSERARSSVAAGGIQAGCGVRLFGGAFTDFAKKSFRLYFRQSHGTRRFKAPIFDGFDRGTTAVDEFEQLELRSGSHDMAMRGFYVSNAFTDDTLLEMGHLNPHGRFVHLYLNGAYWGVYHLRERWGASMHKSYLGGEEGDYESINGNWNVGGWADPGVPYDGDGSTWTRVKSMRSDFLKIRDWLDVPQFVDFMIMWMFGGAEDEYRCVGPTFAGSGFKFYLNDADGWFCIPQYCAAGNRTGRGAPGRQAGDGPGSLFSMLFAGGNPEYRILLADRIQRALTDGGALTPERNQARLERRSAELERPFLLESARWGYLTPSEWAARRDSVVRTWLPQRTAELMSQFRSAGWLPSLSAPVLTRAGGKVEPGFEVRFSGPSTGTIYYTVDGSDPRMPGGEVAASAVPLRTGGGGGDLVLVPEGANWRWKTDGAGLGSSGIVAGNPDWSAANWKHPAFDDAGWASGPAQLGYGEGDEATVIPFGTAAAKWISSYFRHTMVVPEIGDGVGGTIRLKCDDGAVVYVNGREILRHSMPAGEVLGTTLANAASDDGQGFTSFEVPVGVLEAGTNLIAVEVHQGSATTSDASFDLEWVIRRASPPGVPAVRLDRSTLVKARTKNGSQWSALTEAYFQVGPEALRAGEVVIRELNYHPSGAQGVEFIELENVSRRAVNLRGALFTEGVSYAFPRERDVVLVPGQRLVLVSDLQQFHRIYGAGTPVGGVFSGNLDNAGELLRFAGSDGAPVLGFKYGDRAPWPRAADGGGYTIVLAHPDSEPGNPLAWRSSLAPGGTPGGSDSHRFQGDPRADADGDGFPALVEYALGSSDSDPESGRDSVEGGFVPGVDGQLVVHILRDPVADEARLTVEASEDLSAWRPAELRGREMQASGRIRETWGIAVSGRSRGFLRVLVAAGP